jgi:ATP-dependent protease ClpP protease subunit
MPDLPDLHELERWWREHAPSPDVEDRDRDWFDVRADAKKPRKAEVWIYDRIGFDFWSGEGTTAKSFRRKIQALDVDEIELHVNSPGGLVGDGIAIFNSLRDHKAAVHVIVDGLAASAASFIAQAGDTIRMNAASQMMIHRASGIAIGDLKTMEKATEMMRKTDESIASIYAGRAGGDLDEWLKAMTDETWYTAAEAVKAGLADETVEMKPKEPKARNTFDLTIFNYAGRDAAPPPPRIQTQAPAAPPADPPPTQEGAGMDPAKLREALGLKADASDEDVTQAITAAGLVKAAAPPADPPKPGDPPTDKQPEPETLPPKVTVAGQGSDAILLDPVQFKSLQMEAAKGAEAYRKMKEAECDSVLAAAIDAGKFPKSRLDHYKLRWATDPDGTKDEVARLQPNAVPVNFTGYPGVGDETEADMIYQAMYPGGGAGRG